MTPSNDLLEQLDRHLASPNLAWLLGAGISVDASIPLMYPLTERVMKLLADSEHNTLLETLRKALPKNAHIEHLLSSIGDYTALAERSNEQSVEVGGTTFTAEKLKEAHAGVVDKIAETIRWGYEPTIDDDHPERIGSADEPMSPIGNFSRSV